MENECAKKVDDCARDGGICEDTPDSYTCRCAINYLDVSFDRQNRPGRKCKRRWFFVSYSLLSKEI